MDWTRWPAAAVMVVALDRRLSFIKGLSGARKVMLDMRPLVKRSGFFGGTEFMLWTTFGGCLGSGFMLVGLPGI